jgi:hypothetical protein
MPVLCLALLQQFGRGIAGPVDRFGTTDSQRIGDDEILADHQGKIHGFVVGV